MKDKLIFIILMSAGIFSLRSKFFGFFVICTMIVLFIKKDFQIKFNLKNILLLSITTAIVLIFTYQKIDLYFISGGDYITSQNEDIQDSVARAALYFYTPDLYKDYFPFGTGFASYATYASGVYYSKIYGKYGMDTIFGLSKHHCPFIADTYYPALAQFGIVGTILFFAFWYKLTRRALKVFKTAPKEALLAIMIIGFFLIECTTDATITHNRGLFMMMLLGLVFSDIRKSTDSKSE